MFNASLPRVVLGCLVSLLLLCACTSPEDKAQGEYTRIVAIEQTGDVDQALRLYEQLAQQSPKTNGGQLAAEAKTRIVTTREAALRSEMNRQIERLRLALSGYSSMFGKLPASARELDASGFFFDSSYLAEMVPVGYTTYLLLAGDVETWFWPLRADKSIAFVGGLRGELQRVERAAVEQELAARYREVGRKGNLVFLARK